MTKQTTKPVGKKAVTATTGGKPKTSKAAVATIAKSTAAKNPPEKKLAVKKPAAKKPLTKTAEKSTRKIIKTATALPKKSTAPAVKKAATPAPEMKTPAKKTTEKKSKPAVNQKTAVKPTLEERYRMVELAAYFIAEQHGFAGHTDEYWVAAEQQIAARLDL
jgi:hypothetical protein